MNITVNVCVNAWDCGSGSSLKTQSIIAYCNFIMVIFAARNYRDYLAVLAKSFFYLNADFLFANKRKHSTKLLHTKFKKGLIFVAIDLRK